VNVFHQIEPKVELMQVCYMPVFVAGFVSCADGALPPQATCIVRHEEAAPGRRGRPTGAPPGLQLLVSIWGRLLSLILVNFADYP
jgi:hypothetical protein